MKDYVLVEKNSFYYKGKVYDNNDIKKKICKKAEFILLNENIIIKKFKDISKVTQEFIEEIIKIEYGDDCEILTHYEYCKKLKNIYLYSMGNGKLISTISKELQEVNIKPIQFYIKESLPAKIRKINNYIIVIMINNNIYYIEVLYNLIVKSYIEKNQDINNLRIIREFSKDIKFFIDINVENLITKEVKAELNLSIIDIGGKINEKICKA